MDKIYIERTPWHDDGFAEKPADKTATGGELLYRAYGGSSGVLGNCFFVPAIGDTPINHWTAELLERELNAALWGNDFEGITMFNMVCGAQYRIGPIAHDFYVGIEKSSTGIDLFYARSFFTPGRIFKQIKFVLHNQHDLSTCVTQFGQSIRIGAGRYAREASARAKQFRQ
jgi:hypothetical protein